MDFDSQSRVTQSWTSSTALLTEGLHSFVANGKGHSGGTAIFDAVYRACLNQFGRLDRTDSANFILLFSDGEDNASQASVKDAIGMCQRANTAIYIFRAQSQDSFSEGPKTLAELAAKSGGHVFYDAGSDAEVYTDLRTIEADLRNQYRLIYKPAELKRDGSFHRDRVERARAGREHRGPLGLLCSVALTGRRAHIPAMNRGFAGGSESL